MATTRTTDHVCQRRPHAGAAALPRPHPRLPVGKQGQRDPGCRAADQSRSSVYSPVRRRHHHSHFSDGTVKLRETRETSGSGDRRGPCSCPSSAASGRGDGTSQGHSLWEGPQQRVRRGVPAGPPGTRRGPTAACGLTTGPGPSEKLGCAHVGLHPGTEALAGLAEPHT
ncbi:hypothetical protein J1605_003412 [Eschrichtius robustus]|uniref:Uncharacterized protein n=1 Tax=Eschrichtius robustus TaxID=9764 RepID=A0AB34HSB9_ESCRO|nr:hypothetical protein J1605_003412 [Eschrichtius robustus]